MRTAFILKYLPIVVFCQIATFSYAETITLPIAKDLIIKKDKIYDPNHISLDSLQTYEKIFTFDWNNYASIDANKKKVEEIEIFLKSTKPDAYLKLNKAEKQAFGKILYKLGTYYTHVLHSPDTAIERLNFADGFLQNKQDKAWNYDHLAYAYELKFANSGDEEDQKKALLYVDKVISGIYRNGNNKEVAFAYCVKGLVENDMTNKQLNAAQNSFESALKIYDQLPEGKDDQYARAKNRLASIILDMNRDDEAIQMFEQLKKYWLTKKDVTQNPYAARNFLSLGQAYLKIGKIKDARDEVQKAISIYRNIYGDKSEVLKIPYKILSATYKLLGDQKLADSYEQKANSLNGSGQV